MIAPHVAFARAAQQHLLARLVLVLFVAACYSAAGALWLQLGGLPLICDGHGEARWVALGAVKPWAKRNGTAHLPRVPPPALPL